MSKLETNTIDNISGSSTLNIGDTNATNITIDNGVTTLDFGTGISTVSNMPAAFKNTPAFEAYTTAFQSVTEAAYTKLTFATEEFDSDGNYDNSTNYRFTPTTAGKYFVYAKVRTDPSSYENERSSNLLIYKNGSSVSKTSTDSMTGGNTSTDGATSSTHNITAIIDMNGSSDYLEVYGKLNTWSDSGATIGSKVFGAYRIIGV